MIITKRQRKIFIIIIGLASVALVVSSLGGALFYLIG